MKFAIQLRLSWAHETAFTRERSWRLFYERHLGHLHLPILFQPRKIYP